VVSDWGDDGDRPAPPLRPGRRREALLSPVTEIGVDEVDLPDLSADIDRDSLG